MNASTLSLPAECTLRSVHAIARQWKEQTENNAAITLDASKPERVSTVAIQLMLSLAKSAEQAGGSLHIRAVSPALADALHLLGLSEFLNERTKHHV